MRYHERIDPETPCPETIMKRTHTTAGLFLLAFALPLVVGVSRGVAGTRVADLTLRAALPGEKPMDLHMVLAGGRVSAAFAEARTYNTMSYPVDASEVTVTPKGLSGPVTVTIPSDGWVPKGVASITCRYELSAVVRDGKLTGTFRGTCGNDASKGHLTGQLTAQTSKPSRCRFELKARAPKGRKGLRRVGISMGWRNGKPVGVKLIPHGSITDIGAATVTRQAELTWKGSRLVGRIKGVLQPNGKQSRPVLLELSCLVVGDSVGGTLRTKVGDGKWVSGSIRGEMDDSPVPDPTEAIWKLTLQHGVSKGQPMNVFLSTRDGKLAGAFAVTPNYNNATHEVDASKLKLIDGQLGGNIDVTVFPDAWIPKDHKKQSASYTIRAKLTDAEVTGTFLGEFAGNDVKGQIEGVVRAKPKVGNVTRATIKPEGGLWNGSWSGYRAFFSFNVKDGKITGGRVWNNHDKALKGTIEGGTFQVKDETLKATMVAEIQPGTSAKPGKYTIEVSGPVMGTVSCGNSTSKLGDRTWTSRYWASWKYESEE
jgi:hypothetical protein